MKLRLLAVLCLSAVCFGQGATSTGPPQVVNGLGQPIPGATVAVCVSYPGLTATPPCADLVATFTDITLGTACTGTNPLLPLSNPGGLATSCANPGAADAKGNVVAYAASGVYWCEYYGQVVSHPYIVPCTFPGSGGGSGTVSGTVPHVAKFTSATSVGDSSGLDPGNTPTQWPLGLNVIGNAGYVQKTAGTGGLVANELVSNDASANGIVTPAGTSKALGIADAGVAAGAADPIAVWGFHNCIFDNQTTASDYFGPSSTTDGLCTDVGATKPSNVEILGTIQTVNTGAGTLALVDLFTGDTVAPGAAGGSGTVSPCASSNSVAFYQTPGTVINCDSLHTDDAIGHVTAKTLGLTDTTSAGFWWWVQGAAPPAQPANSIELSGPVSVPTAYRLFLPSATPVLNDCLGITALSGTDATIDWVACSGGGGGSGTVTSVTAGTGLTATPNPIVVAGTINLADTAVTPGAYTNADITVNQQGQIIAAANGSSGGTGTVTSVGLSLPSIFNVTGSPVTTSGTLGATFVVPGAGYLPTSTAANTVAFKQVNGGSSCGDGTHAVSWDFSTQLFGCQTLTTGGSGSVTSVGLSINGGSSSGIFAATGTPVTTSGTLNYNLTGTSGGIPYFSSTSVLSSSALLTASNPVIGGGAGTAPSSGARSGNTTTFGTTSGTLTSGHSAKFDASGNIIDGGAAPASSTACPGVTATGTACQLAYYPNDTVTGTTTGTPVKLKNYATNQTQVIKTQAADFHTGWATGVIGICVSGCGNSGVAAIAISGTAQCTFSSAATQGDEVEISSTGVCNDNSSAGFNEDPNLHAFFARVRTTTGGAGLADVDLISVQPVANQDATSASVGGPFLATIYGGGQNISSSPVLLDSTVAGNCTASLPCLSTPSAWQVKNGNNKSWFQIGASGFTEIDTAGNTNSPAFRMFSRTATGSMASHFTPPDVSNPFSGSFFDDQADTHILTLNANAAPSPVFAVNKGHISYWKICQDSTGGRTWTMSGVLFNEPLIPSAASACITFDAIGVDNTHIYAIDKNVKVVATSQTAAITTTNLGKTQADSTYRVTVTLDCDSSSAAATVNATIGWTDPSNTAQTQSFASAVVCTTLGSASVGNLITAFRAKTGTNITYATSIVNTPTYDVTVTVETLTSN